ncbi:unnamed protein product, partial [Cyprideis torosa]
MIKIYHNPRCGKSREGLALLEAQGVDFELRKYLDEPFSEKELTELIHQLGMKPIELVRTKEQIWKEEFKGKSLDDKAIIKAMLEHPRLIERPI